MAKPDTRRRDRAAYMRDYRAKKAKERPGLQAQIDDLRARIAGLEAFITNNRWIAGLGPDTFGVARPAPKQKAKG